MTRRVPPASGTRVKRTIEYVPGCHTGKRQACTIRSPGINSIWRPVTWPSNAENSAPAERPGTPGIPDKAESAAASASTAYTWAGLAEIIVCCWMLMVVFLLIASFGLDWPRSGRHQHGGEPNSLSGTSAATPHGSRLGRTPHSYDSFQ